MNQNLNSSSALPPSLDETLAAVLAQMIAHEAAGLGKNQVASPIQFSLRPAEWSEGPAFEVLVNRFHRGNCRRFSKLVQFSINR